MIGGVRGVGRSGPRRLLGVGSNSHFLVKFFGGVFKVENFEKLRGREHLSNLGVLTMISGSKIINRGKAGARHCHPIQRPGSAVNIVQHQ